jgi:hypothetical protein
VTLVKAKVLGNLETGNDWLGSMRSGIGAGRGLQQVSRGLIIELYSKIRG